MAPKIKLTPEQLAALDRFRRDRPRPKPRNGKWPGKAETLARELGIDQAAILAEHDHRADLLEWDGVKRAEAEERAWTETVELLRGAA
jgi:hypothetical protein